MTELEEVKQELYHAKKRINELEYRLDKLINQLLDIFNKNNIKHPY